MHAGLRHFLTGLLLTLATAGAALAQQSPRIGVTTTVNDATNVQAAAGGDRILAVGDDVFSRDTIVTDGTGQTHLLFLDQSTLTVGPNAEVLIDEFVYNPQAGDDLGRLAISVNQGVMRFVGGALSNTEDQVEITTPTATLAIRGGIVVVLVQGGTGDTQVIFVFGDFVDVTGPGGQTETIRRRGYAVTVSPDGVSEPEPAPPEAIDAVLGALEGPPGDGSEAESITQAFGELGFGEVILTINEPFDTAGPTTSDIETDLGVRDADEQLIRDVIETIELIEEEEVVPECECSPE